MSQTGTVPALGSWWVQIGIIDYGHAQFLGHRASTALRVENGEDVRVS